MTGSMKYVIVILGLLTVGVYCAKRDDEQGGGGGGGGKGNKNKEPDFVKDIVANLPSNLGDFLTIVVKTIFNPFGWRKEVCGTKARKPEKPKEPFLTAPKMDTFMEYLKSVPANVVELLKLGSDMMQHNTEWKEKYCGRKN